MFQETSMIDHVPDIEQYWEEQSAIVDAMRTDGVAAYMRAHAQEVERAFHLDDRWVRCIDEGTPGGLHLAGAGILLPMEEAVVLVKEAHADGITSHAGCGAAARVAQERGIHNAEQFAQDHARALAEAAGVPYRHIGQSALQRPAGSHIARVVYYDGTGNFDPSQTAELPKGFVVSRRYLPSVYAQKEVAMSIAIARGPHGFGGRITQERPLLIIPVGDSRDPEYSVAALQKEVADMANSSGGDVIVDGFMAAN